MSEKTAKELAERIVANSSTEGLVVPIEEAIQTERDERKELIYECASLRSEVFRLEENIEELERESIEVINNRDELVGKLNDEVKELERELKDLQQRHANCDS